MKKILLAGILLTSISLLAQKTQINSANDTNSSEALLDQFVKSKGNSNIVFDTSNIKLFWIDNSVVGKKDSFEVFLNDSSNQGNESAPLTIQLVNVNETLDCRVEVISETEDLYFSILNNSSKVLASSQKENAFLSYFISSSLFHMEDTKALSFRIKFGSKTKNVVSIKKIVLSFSNNKASSFLSTPGKINLLPQHISTSSKFEVLNNNAVSVTGKQSIVFSTKKILTEDNPLTCSMTIKNTGTCSTYIHIGYAVYTKDQIKLDGRNYPYRANCKALNVISASAGSNKIIIDNYSDWTKNCHLALNAKDDLSDIPNKTLLEGRIVEIKKMNNGQAEITLDKPLNIQLKDGTKIRVHGQGGSYLYTQSKTLQPGNEEIFTSTLKKDDGALEYSSKAFSKDVYFVIPVILSYSVDPNIENSITINDFTVSF